MTLDVEADDTFKELELKGWNQKARDYGDYAGKITLQAVEPLLNAVEVGPGSVFLDIATGPGYTAGAAQARGAIATGVDFSAAMIGEASRNYPKALFYEGDAEHLVFPSGFFDAAACPFGLLHMANPDRAISEAWRILKPGGKFAFTVWAAPEKHAFFELVLGAISRHGAMDVALPEAPPFFRFSDPGESRGALEKTGFSDIDISELVLHWQPSNGQQLLDTIYKSTVRTAMLLEAQEEDAREKIHSDIIAAVSASTGPVNLPWPALIAVARKPL
ncbi:MAG: methyltransferase domain-containing protein [Gammaproteobacteria bacterium]|nr:methyltransferase domain-containing protein [Gammaproteobacteria bacterium]MBQ0840999.1 methyltransferase domain-containing protein [Gammaproteobacteria bacterium]